MNHLYTILKGMTIGVANVIPGVSGGTLALIMGIYNHLTEAIGNFFTNKEKRKEYFFFLLKVIGGAILGILIFAKILGFLLEYNQVSRQITYAFFIGLIGGSIPFIVKSHNDMKINFSRTVMFVIGVVLILFTILFTGSESGAELDHTSPLRLLWLFVSGALAGGSMVIPGFSGSALLVALGEYETVTALYLNDIGGYLVPILFFSFGAAFGIVIFAKIIEVCFKKFKAGTLYLILGLIAASVIQVVGGIRAQFDFSILPVIGFIVSLVAGFFIAYLSSKLKKE